MDGYRRQLVESIIWAHIYPVTSKKYTRFLTSPYTSKKRKLRHNGSWLIMCKKLTFNIFTSKVTYFITYLEPKCKFNKIFLITHQPFRHWDVMTASFPTNFSGVLLLPCRNWWFIILLTVWYSSSQKNKKVQLTMFTLIITFSFTENGYCTLRWSPSAEVKSPFSWNKSANIHKFVSSKLHSYGL